MTLSFHIFPFLTGMGEGELRSISNIFFIGGIHAEEHMNKVKANAPLKSRRGGSLKRLSCAEPLCPPSVFCNGSEKKNGK